MGRYINIIDGKFIGNSYEEKCTALLNAEATEITTPTEFKEGLVCVINNGPFAAAGYAYSPQELYTFKHLDQRPSRWFDFPNAKKYAK